jgi:hypothetical protein
VTNRISEHLPEPDPKKPAGADDPDLAKASFPKGDGNQDNPIEDTGPSGREEAGEPRRLRPRIPWRPDMSPEELERLAEDAKVIRDQTDQSTAPPIDHDLVYGCVWGTLSHEQTLEVEKLGIQFGTWNLALLAETLKKLAHDRTAESN